MGIRRRAGGLLACYVIGSMRPHLALLLAVLSAPFYQACGDRNGQPSYAGNTTVRIDWLFPVYPDRVESHVCCGESLDTCLVELLSGELIRYESGPGNAYVFEPTNVTEMILDLPQGWRCSVAFYLECGGEILCTGSQTFDVPSEGQHDVDIVSVCNPRAQEKTDACLAAR